MNIRQYRIKSTNHKTGSVITLEQLDDLYYIFNQVPREFIYPWIQSVRDDLRLDNIAEIISIKVSYLATDVILISIEYRTNKLITG